MLVGCAGGAGAVRGAALRARGAVRREPPRATAAGARAPAAAGARLFFLRLPGGGAPRGGARRRGTATKKKSRIVILGYGTARQRMVLKCWKNLIHFGVIVDRAAI